ncbi:hypothetical protein HDU77_010879 [Chytriomyces hyalinus]|nr:hypothetical protein HDU77_010879 [Chytriomyces hyalinus]
MDLTDKTAVEMQILQRMVSALEETVLKLTREVALLKQEKAYVDGRVIDRDTRPALMSHAPAAVVLAHDEVRGMDGVEMTHGITRGLDGLNERGHGLDRLNAVLPNHASDGRDAVQDDQGGSSDDFMGWDPSEVCVKYQTGNCDKPGSRPDGL